jgi:hypothetical protein
MAKPDDFGICLTDGNGNLKENAPMLAPDDGWIATSNSGDIWFCDKEEAARSVLEALGSLAGKISPVEKGELMLPWEML